MAGYKIPFNKPFLGTEELEMVRRAIKTEQTTGDSFYGRKLREAMQKKLKVRYVLPTPSGTAALELAIMALELGSGDEVILPSFNFASGAVAILRAGAKPVFVDIEQETFCLDPRLIEGAIAPKTKAIMVVHYAGHACDMGAILKLVRKYNCRVIEDASHAIGAKYQGKYLGTIGDIGCYSFHGTKNIVTGEGGAFATNDEKIFRKAEIIREKGTNHSAFIRGEIDKYSLVSLGSSYLLSDVLAAMAIAQFRKLDRISSLRERHASHLLAKLADLKTKLQLPAVKSYADSNWHIFSLLVNSRKREKFIQFLKQAGIEASAHYLPLHSSPLGRKLGWAKLRLTNTDLVSQGIVRLPLYPDLTKEKLDYMVKKIHEAARKIL